MTYYITTTTTSGSVEVALSDAQLNTTQTSLALPGRNSVNYGQAVNQNLVLLLQNFAGLNQPANPQVGQLWYDTAQNSLNVWNGTVWIKITPDFDNLAGSHNVAIQVGLDTYYVTAIISDQQIVAVFSEHAFTGPSLPSQVAIGSIYYDLATRFPLGITAGLTLATQNGNLLVMTGIATQASELETARNISLQGDISGNVKFDGSSDVTITTALSNLNIAGTYQQVTVDNTGRVTSGNVNLGNAAIITALGYTPIGSIDVIGDMTAQATLDGSVYTLNMTLANSGVSAGTYNSVTVDSKGIVRNATVSMDLPQYGIILWVQTIPLPDNFAICNGQTVTGANGVVIRTPDLRTYTVGPTTYVMRIS